MEFLVCVFFLVKTWLMTTVFFFDPGLTSSMLQISPSSFFQGL